MEVAKYLSWITSTIRDNGGLASCDGFMITADPVLGNNSVSQVIPDLPIYRGDGPGGAGARPPHDRGQGLNLLPAELGGVLWLHELLCPASTAAPQWPCILCHTQRDDCSMRGLDQG